MLEIFKRTPKKEITEPVLSNISTLVREGNDLFSDTLILLDERLSGNLFCAEKIVVEQNGVLSGNITSKSCVVSGKITGNIVSTDQMDIKSTAVIRGNIKSPLINIEPGAVINGCVTIAKDTAGIAENLSEKITKVHSERDLQDKLYPGIPKLHAEPEPLAEIVKLNRELKAPVSKTNTIAQPVTELTNLIPASNSSDDEIKVKQPTAIAATPIAAMPKEEEKPLIVAAPEKKSIPVAPSQEENTQRWW